MKRFFFEPGAVQCYRKRGINRTTRGSSAYGFLCRGCELRRLDLQL